MVNCHVSVELNFKVCDGVVSQVVFVYLFTDNEKPHMVFLLKHDFHLVENKLQLFPLVHRPIGLDLHLLKDTCGLQNIIIVLLTLDQHQHAPGVLNLNLTHSTSKKIFFAVTSRIVSISWVR